MQHHAPEIHLPSRLITNMVSTACEIPLSANDLLYAAGSAYQSSHVNPPGILLYVRALDGSHHY